jgi:hypothetical protein
MIRHGRGGEKRHAVLRRTTICEMAARCGLHIHKSGSATPLKVEEVGADRRQNKEN